MTTTISINDIYQAIAALDPSGAYKQISYDLTAQNSLSQTQWWTFIPYGEWNNPLTTPTPSPFESAVIQSIQNVSLDAWGNECFIDISHLGASEDSVQAFFADKASGIATVIIGLINKLATHVKVTIRYIIGDAQTTYDQDGFVQALLSGPAITHDNVRLYIGSFTPGIELSEVAQTSGAQALESGANAMWDLLTSALEEYSPEFRRLIKGFESEITSWTKRFVNEINLGSGSWNHSKIFAINGRPLLIGGANYWSDYATGSTSPFDLAMSITGDAAIASHKFADYLWQYLNSIPPTDRTSWRRAKNLSLPNSPFTYDKAPMSPDFPSNTGQLAALFVGKNGIWSNTDLQLPATLFDAIRDFLINLLAVVVETHFNDHLDIIPFVTKTLSEENPEFVKALNDVGINPSAWASRNARNYAISQAQESLRFSQQKFVLDDQIADSQDFRDFICEINALLELKWDGFLWPYDTMMALGYALTNMEQNTGSVTGVQIVCSYLQGAQGGYNDSVSVEQFTDKLAEIMAGMRTLGYINPSGDIPSLIQEFLVYKRIAASNAGLGNHSKLVIVDDAVCYIGSDNAYPCYNQEFGIWIDDQTSINALVNGFWDPSFSFAQPPLLPEAIYELPCG